MECPVCGRKDLNNVAVWDDPNRGYAYNLFSCFDCGSVIKQDVWENAGLTVIKLDTTVLKIAKEK